MTNPRTDKPAVPRVLTVAGSDSGGGAGIQADIKVIACLGGYAMSALTALTAQDTRGVWGVHPVPAEFVAQQIGVCLSDIGADAVKTGMLCNAPIARAVAASFRAQDVKNLVVDPVMFSKSAHRLIDEEAEGVLVKEILPLAALVTPNLSEASRLAGFEINNLAAMRRAAEVIAGLGPAAVLVKGGHLVGNAVDLLYDGQTCLEFPGERFETKNTHGTGCSLSAALATGLARGLSLPEAVGMAKRFITEAIRFALPLGSGHGPTNPLAAAQALAAQVETGAGQKESGQSPLEE